MSALGVHGVSSESTQADPKQTLNGHRKQTQGKVGVCFNFVKLDLVGSESRTLDMFKQDYMSCKMLCCKKHAEKNISVILKNSSMSHCWGGGFFGA